ncbi:AraC family transcriptional regulator [Variovorax sp. J22R133]|uniref:AraC family transcriptional regulator n=1 Tax=Variovorax brevis TaxID=3053503 RepID=UPI0025766BE4|nr:AraC family transcriptional regulator [Variovorax sp. J22R133]MDM0111788.1 AraC family transcriptional regulator [Variovorax sp. J22R133]
MAQDAPSLDVARPAASVRYLDLLARAAAHVDANLDAPLDVDVLAQRAAMSRHHFHRIFHAHFGLTVGGYVTWRRLRRACELLALPGGDAVMDVALAVGFATPQALAKAMRRELDATPSQVRSGHAPQWDAFFVRREIRPGDRPGSPERESPPPLHPQWALVPAFAALTATGHGMRNGSMSEAAQQGFGELWPALEAAGLASCVTHCIAALPEEPQGPDDQNCRMLTGALFGMSLPQRRGAPEQPEIALQGSLVWTHWPAGRYAVFTHIGPYDGLHATWKAIYRHWLPATGYALRDVPGFDLYVDHPRATPPERLRTDLYLPLQ